MFWPQLILTYPKKYFLSNTNLWPSFSMADRKNLKSSTSMTVDKRDLPVFCIRVSCLKALNNKWCLMRKKKFIQQTALEFESIFFNSVIKFLFFKVSLKSFKIKSQFQSQKGFNCNFVPTNKVKNCIDQLIWWH
jgi:hypothetical protein